MSPVSQRMAIMRARLGKNKAGDASTAKTSLAALAKERGGIVMGARKDVVVVFDRPEQALECAVAAIRHFTESNRALESGRRVSPRIAVHSGEAEVVEDDLKGAAAELSARLLEVTPAGRVFASGSAVSPALGRAGCAFIGLGKELFDCAPEPVEVYEVVPAA